LELKVKCAIYVFIEKSRATLARALAPDDVCSIARSLKTEVSFSENAIEYRAEGEGLAALRELRSSVNDVLRCLAAASATLLRVESVSTGSRERLK